MASYIVSARKYRPNNFETLVGQDNIAKTLKNSILRGQLAHAYLFCGPRGVGKTTTARIFAKMINCSNPRKDMEPCGECESCLSFAENRSYCIHELDAASNNGVEDIKALIDQVRIPPQVGKYSVYIIDEVHMLSQAAFNAFLKTLEEPPAHAIFILATTEKHKILPTILSRCQTYDFNRISVEDITGNLRTIAQKEGIDIDEESLHIIAQKADGAMRDALTIFDQTIAFCGDKVRSEEVMKNLNVLSYEHSFSLVDNFLNGDYPSALLKFDEILSKGFNAVHFISSLSTHLRNLIISKSAGLESLLELPRSLKEKYAEQAARCQLKFLFDALAISSQCEAGYKASINPRLHIEFSLMKICNLVGIPEVTATPVRAADGKPDSDAPQNGNPRRRRIIATGLSLKEMASDQEPDTSAVRSNDNGKLPEENDIRTKWMEIAKMYDSKPRLASAISSGKLMISNSEDNVAIKFMVANEAQRKWLEDKMLAELESHLKKLLGTGRIKLEIRITPQEEIERRAYNSGEQATEMIKSHPELGNLINDLDATLK